MSPSALHDVRFPGESDEYRQARDELLRAEIELRRQVEQVAAQRRALPPGGELPDDYSFAEWDSATGSPRQVRLSDLFGDNDTLFLYSFMFKPGREGLPLEVPCEVCTSIIDAIEGEAPHVAEHIAFAVVTKAPIERFCAHGKARGWRQVRLLSSAGTTYNRDYKAEDEAESQFAMTTVFTREDGAIRHFWSSELWYVGTESGQNPRHVDFMWPLWGVLDRTPGGRGTGWMPKLQY